MGKYITSCAKEQDALSLKNLSEPEEIMHEEIEAEDVSDVQLSCLGGPQGTYRDRQLAAEWQPTFRSSPT